MGFFDRFRPEPKWKHADPAVRAAAVQDVPDDEEDLLASLATSDPDTRVRRAALRRVNDPATLAQVLRAETDADTRDEAAELLLRIALDPGDITQAERAIAGLSDPRHLAQVARTAELESIARAALDRISDSKALAGVARQSPLAAVRLAALARVAEPGDLVSVAVKTEHKDAALAALERIDDTETLETIATRARTKACARRARARLAERRQLQPAASPEGTASPHVASAPHRAERARVHVLADLCAAAEAIAASAEGPELAARLRELEKRWHDALNLPGAPEVADAEVELQGRFDAACESVRQELAKAEQERTERERRAAEVRRAVEERNALSESVEALDGDEAAARVEQARASWASLAELSAPAIAAAAQRFERACADAAARHARHAAARERAAQLETLAAEAEQLAGADDLGPVRARWKTVNGEWVSRAAGGAVDAGIAARFDAAVARYRERDAELRARRAAEQQENVTRLQQLAVELARLASQPNLTLKQAGHAMQRARAVVEHPGHLPSRRDQEAVAQQFRALHAAIQARAQELREAEDWQRWANVSVQETLIGRVEALREIADPAEAARQLRQAQDEWKKVSAAPKEKAQELWLRFKAAGDAVRAQADAWFAQQREERTANLVRKEALCARAEALTDSTEWLKTAEEIKALQAEWKTIGPGLRDKAIWERFRAACDKFFTRRHADLAQRKEAWAQNQQRKEALCARVEALADTTTGWDAAVAEVRRLQVEWRGIGPVRRSRSDDLWQRFVRAGERFLERYQQRDLLALQAKLAEREAICREMEQLAGIVRRPVAAAAPPPDPTTADPDAREAGRVAEGVGSSETADDISSSETADSAADDGMPEAAPIDAAADSEAAVSIERAPPVVHEAAPAQEGAADLPAYAPGELVARVQSIRTRWQGAPPIPREQLEPYNERFSHALAALTERRGAELRGTDLDANANRQKMEALCARVEALLSDGVPAENAASPAATLAAQLREALAANTIGGRVSDELKWKAAGDEVKEAQAAWRRIGPVPGSAGRQLDDRFHRACARFFDQQRRHAPATPPVRSAAGPPRRG